MTESLLRSADPAAGVTADPDGPTAQALLQRIVTSSRAAERHVPHRRRRLVLGAGLAGAAVAVIALAPWNGDTPGLGDRAYAVSTSGDGTIHVTVRWSQLDDPGALQDALDRAHARTRIFLERSATDCAPVARTVGYAAGAVDWHAPARADEPDGIVLRPGRFPPGATFVLVVSLAPPGSVTGSTFGPGVPAITGTLSYMAVGPVAPPHCTR